MNSVTLHGKFLCVTSLLNFLISLGKVRIILGEWRCVFCSLSEVRVRADLSTKGMYEVIYTGNCNALGLSEE